MNQHLQKILDLIQQSEHLSAEEKDNLLKSAKDADKELEITAFKLERTEKVKRTTAILLEETIEELENKRKAIEGQNRELEIESSLERVRTVAMSMMKPDDLLNVCKIQFSELKQLGFNEIRNALINTFDDSKDFFLDYDYSDLLGGAITKIPLNAHPIIENHIRRIRGGVDAFSEVMIPESELKEWIENRRARGEADDPRLENIKVLYYYFYSIGSGAIGISAYQKLSAEQLTILKRFRNVFDLAYRRYVDITLAEAQAREAQIELGLERVRAKAMAMQTSEELNDLISTVFIELTKLDFVLTRCVLMIYGGVSNDSKWWMANSEQPDMPMGFYIKAHNHQPITAYFKAWNERQVKWTYILEGKTKKEWDGFLFSETELKALPDFVIAGMKAPDKVYLNASFNNFGNLTLATLEPLSQEHFDILLRFAKVFDLTYTRFNDLKQAEAQAKEARIETALERVRSRSLAMHQSDELQEVVNIVFERLKDLDVETNSASVIVFPENSDNMEFWVAVPGQNYSVCMHAPYFDHTVVARDFTQARKSGKPFIKSYTDKEKNEQWKYLFEHSDFKNIPEERKKFLLDAKAYTVSVAFTKNTALQLLRYHDQPFAQKENEILQRFANVFEQAYVRFLDLKKAEARTKEARIETALEKVRARTMAMQHSHELSKAVAIVFEELDKLDLGILRCGIGILNKEKHTADIWTTTKLDNNSLVQVHGDESMDIHPLLIGAYEAWMKQEDFSYVLKGKDLNDYYKAIAASNFKLPESQSLVSGHDNVIQYYYNTLFPAGGLFAFSQSEFSSESITILKRFADVFNLTYTRFNDLKQAEAQAWEGKIQLALERVRARTMAMQRSDELSETAVLLFQQLSSLGLELKGCGFNIWEKDEKTCTAWMSGPNGTLTPPFNLPLTEDPFFIRYYESRQKGEDFWVYETGKEELINRYKYLQTLPVLGDILKHESVNGIELPPFIVDHFVNFSNGNLVFVTYKHYPEAWDIFKRFGKVFEQTYTRFLDLQKAEVQAKEAKIEASLERVRSRTMAMHQTSELQEVIHTVHNELLNLNLSVDGGSFVVINDDVGPELRCWGSGGTANTSQEVNVPHFNMPFCTDLVKGIKSGLEFFTEEFSQAEKKEYFTKLFEHKPWSELGDVQKKEILSSAGGYTRSVAVSKHTSIFVINHHGRKFTEDENDIVKRFAKVFEQTYTRFLDLQKAEAQAKESQIQLALERVRARTMAMQHSDELPEAANVLFQQVKTLGLDAWSAGYCIWDDDHQALTLWMSSLGIIQKPFRAPVNEDPSFIHMYEAWKRGDTFYVEAIGGNEIVTHYQYMLKLPVVGDMLKQLLADGGSLPTYQIYHLAFFSQGFLLFITYEPVPEAHDTFKRFGNVFDQTYTRFLDLQKAEAQVREAQIEASLEKVRSKTMAMHKSTEVQSVITEVANQLHYLEFKIDAANFDTNLDIHKDPDLHLWIAVPGRDTYPAKIVIPYFDHPIINNSYACLDRGDTFFADTYTKEEKDGFFRYGFEHSNLKYLPEDRKQFVFNGKGMARSVAIAKYTALAIYNYDVKPYSNEENSILIRFANVFDQAYTRFLDLQRAEAQAREAQIEASLERVRSKTMAMHNSEDVATTVLTIFDEIIKLDIDALRCGIGIIKGNGEMEVWTAKLGENGKSDLVAGILDMTKHPLLQGAYDGWVNKHESFSYELKTKEEVVAYYDVINNSSTYPIKYDTSLMPDAIYHNDFYFSDGSLYVFSKQKLSEETGKIFKRFASVLGQTYRRYLDLQKAEAQTKEAQVEAALERVRSRTLAMQRSDELAETAAVVFRQLIHLGIAPNRLYIAIIKDDSGKTEFWITDEDGAKISSAFQTNLNDNSTFKKMLQGWREERKSLVIDMQGEELQDYFKYLTSINVPFKGGLSQTRRVQEIAYFAKGFIGIASPDVQTGETMALLERFAAVFNLTYTRFNDLKIAEAHAIQAGEDLIKLQTEKKRAEDALNELQATQKQLIQSEKMASLGELTAGIAHEIQNPLNFVNNFSEVSKELLDEMKDELDNGNAEDAIQLANDVIQNLEKINHHGKRADAIVKGMLQHSRSSTSTKEPTDINKLADEYLRLAYHGLRAKDKSFNAAMKTDFDESVGTIQIVPQDVGRVILNLLTNAFYVVNEKKQSTDKEYQPTVSVSTKRLNDKVEIRVADNGNGVPKKVLDKIFQPFFTTKPTGQGTGLGLSLSYDIITKGHGGELKVETKEGEGSVFIIDLPVNNI